MAMAGMGGGGDGSSIGRGANEGAGGGVGAAGGRAPGGVAGGRGGGIATGGSAGSAALTTPEGMRQQAALAARALQSRQSELSDAEFDAMRTAMGFARMANIPASRQQQRIAKMTPQQVTAQHVMDVDPNIAQVLGQHIGEMKAQAIKEGHISDLSPDEQASYAEAAARAGFTDLAADTLNKAIGEERGFLGKLRDKAFDIDRTVSPEMAAKYSKNLRSLYSGLKKGVVKSEEGVAAPDVVGQATDILGSFAPQAALLGLGFAAPALTTGVYGKMLGKIAPQMAVRSLAPTSVRGLAQSGLGYATTGDLGAFGPFGAAVQSAQELGDINQALGMGLSPVAPTAPTQGIGGGDSGRGLRYYLA